MEIGKTMSVCPVCLPRAHHIRGVHIQPISYFGRCGLGGAVICPAFEGKHLRENHIIPEIIGETGKVLPDGEYGELVITTIGADAMPLIRYRTSDYTRILPPCPCGGVTKRLDTVSRRGGEISIEELDSALFRIPELVDYRVSFIGVLTIEAKMRSTGMEQEIYSAVQSLYSDMQISVCTSLCQCSDRSMYPGKRYLENKDN